MPSDPQKVQQKVGLLFYLAWCHLTPWEGMEDYASPCRESAMSGKA